MRLVYGAGNRYRKGISRAGEPVCVSTRTERPRTRFEHLRGLTPNGTDLTPVT